MPKDASIRDHIRGYIADNPYATSSEHSEHLGVTRQAVSLQLRRLLSDGEIFTTGSTRAARYFPREAAAPERHMKRDLRLAGLEESAVYKEVAITLTLSRLPGNVESIVRYAFTEMLNNAIDHSMADRCTIEVRLDATRLSFSVRDRGIGVFHSIADKFDLRDEHEAMIELVKGKTTTQPDAHSGEGIFFVSKAADRYVLRSHRLQIEWDRYRDDVFVSEPRYLQGTLVQFEILVDSRTKLEQVFDEFAPAEYDYRFEKTRVVVKLLQREYVSRSEAKRLLHNLDKFAEIELDMRDVTRVGQGFADEIFRVFAAAHPAIVIRTVNAGKATEAMIRHVAKNVR
jgi:anti-sigma regulatory factor (Ser/Thr protein kinase)